MPRANPFAALWLRLPAAAEARVRGLQVLFTRGVADDAAPTLQNLLAPTPAGQGM